MLSNIDNIRHSLAHVMALAVKRLFKDVKFGIGPVTDTGFFYDFDFGKSKLGEADLEKIEKEMIRIIKENIFFIKKEINTAQAKKLFAEQPYKLELIKDLIKYGTTEFAEIKKLSRSKSGKPRAGTKITVYTIGEFKDLCRGGHVKSTSDIKADSFKLTNIAGAYWRGDEKNSQMTRIYGAAYNTKKELDKHLKMLAEAKRRDHRLLGKKLDLFTFSDLVGAGLPMFTPKGTIIRNELEKYLEELQIPRGYKKVWIPHLAKKELYIKSGHWDKFSDDIFHVSSKGEDKFVLKPMNCPHHTQIYSSRPRSYRDLPIRYFEVTEMYRDEKPGQLQGLTRVRAVTIDDAHCFCTPEQVREEAEKIYDIIEEFYKTFEMKIIPRLSTRDPAKPDDYIGDKKRWDEAEKILRAVLKKRVKKFEEVPGEAAFYGPKIDFEAEDVLGRKWQLATIQLDFAMPERFNLEYINEKGEKKRTAMLHRAISGSLERFMAILIEHFEGAFPLWLSPVQVALLPINDKHKKYCLEIARALKKEGIREQIEKSDETLGKRIRNAEIDKIPYIVVVGDKEMEASTVNVRRKKDNSQETLTLNDFIKQLKKEIESRSL